MTSAAQKRLTGPALLAVTSVLLIAMPGRGEAFRRVGSPAGVIVEDVPADPPTPSGLMKDDRVVSWSRDPLPSSPDTAQGLIDDPFSFLDMLLEQSPRSEVSLEVWRAGEKRLVSLPVSSSSIAVRPAFDDTVLALYEEGRSHIAEKDKESGIERWRQATDILTRRGRRADAAWLAYRSGLVWAESLSWEKAQSAYASAVVGGRPLTPRQQAFIFHAQGIAYRRQNELVEAEAAFQRALAARDLGSPGSLAGAEDLYQIGNLRGSQGNTAAAEEAMRTAIERLRAMAPASGALSRALGDMAEFRRTDGDMKGTEALLREALAIDKRRGTETLEMARTLSGLGNLAYTTDDYSAAQELYERSLAIRQRLAPESLAVAASLNNLGVVAGRRGDYATAEGFYRRSLAIRERLAPGTLRVAGALSNLGQVLTSRGDFEGGEAQQRKALEILERLAPESADTATVLEMLGDLAIEREEWDRAEGLYRRALVVRRAQGDQTRIAWTLGSLGIVSRRRGALEQAESLFQQARAASERAGTSLYLDERRLDEQLGLTYRAMGQWERAAEVLGRVAEVAERRWKPLSTRLGDLSRSAEVLNTDWALVDALVELQRPREAFERLARVRGSGLLSVMAERALMPEELPAEWEAERRRLDSEHDALQSALSKIDASKQPEERERIKVRLQGIREELDALVVRIRRASPRSAAWRYPPALTLPETARLLDPGTVFLVYSVGEDRTLLFVVRPDRPGQAASALSVFKLADGRGALAQKIGAFRDLVQGGAAIDAVRTRGADLYRELVQPAESVIRDGQRVLISADGPLLKLPFAALVRERRPGRSARGGRFFVEWKPVHQIGSLTLYAEIRKARRPFGTGGRLVAFGDPKYPPLTADGMAALPNPQLRRVLGRGQALVPLPATRSEVERIAKMASVPVTTYLGDEATEERAKSLGPDVRYLHFACHAVVDEESALDSGLVLTVPEKPGPDQGNGILQAWEIFEGMRLDADLVTLSACDSGLGKTVGGEGLIGLSGAFQHAGARSVLASLWEVSDEATAELMSRFYARLFRGTAKDEALRKAQLDLIRRPQTSHPFYWAAFQLYGDWR